MPIYQYASVPKGDCFSGSPLQSFLGSGVSLDQYREQHTVFFTHNMQVEVREVGEDTYLMSVVRNDGSKIDCSNGLYSLHVLKSQLFPSNYVAIEASDYVRNFEPMYPVCVLFDRVYRQTAKGYNEEVIFRWLIRKDKL